MTSRTFRLREVCEIQNGFPFDSSMFSEKEGMPLVRIRDLRHSVCSLRFNSDFDQAYVVRSGDILIGMDGEFNAFEWQGEDALLNQRVCRLIPNDGLLDPTFLLHKIKSDLQRIEDTTASTTVKHLSSKQLGELEWSLPKFSEQRRIAAHLKAQLAAVEEARQAAQVQLADVQRLIPAILEAAFTEIADAELVRIGDVARTTSGTTPSRSRKDYWEQAKYPWVKTGEVAFAPIRGTEECISEAALAECSLSLLPPGTVLIAMYGQGKTRGQSAVLEIEAATNQACFAILPNETFDSEYLQFWLRHSYQNLRAQSEARGGNQSNLNGEMLNGFEVPLVPRDRQEGIAKKIKAGLAEADQVRQAIETQLQEIELLPARLLAQVFGTPA